MTPTSGARQRGRWTLIAVMLLVATWSGLLAVGFGYAAVVTDDVSGVRRVAYALAALFLSLLAARTGYEMVRRLRGRG